MSYIGQDPVQGEYIKLDSISVTATDTFALQKCDECIPVSDIDAALAEGRIKQWVVDQNLRRIDSNGDIFFPFVGYVEVVGKTVSQVRDELSIALSNEFKNKTVKVIFKKIKIS